MEVVREEAEAAVLDHRGIALYRAVVQTFIKQAESMEIFLFQVDAAVKTLLESLLQSILEVRRGSGEQRFFDDKCALSIALSNGDSDDSKACPA